MINICTKDNVQNKLMISICTKDNVQNNLWSIFYLDELSPGTMFGGEKVHLRRKNRYPMHPWNIRFFIVWLLARFKISVF